MTDFRESPTRGISVRPEAGGPEEIPPRPDQPQEFKPITIIGLDRVEESLAKNGLTHRTVSRGGESFQLLIYRTSEVEEAKRLSDLAHGSPLRQPTPEGIIWDNRSGQYLALPVVWTDALTESVRLENWSEGAVLLKTSDRAEHGGKVNARILHKGNVYTEQAWRRAQEASQLTQENLGLPPGSPASAAELEPIQWSAQGWGSFRPDGFYSSPPGTRYGFMGWVGPKKS